MADCNLPLPCTQTGSDLGPLLQISNTGTGGAIQGNCPDGVGLSGTCIPPVGSGSVGTGVQGSAQRGNGVLGTSVDGIGVVGDGGDAGVEGESRNGTGVRAQSAFGSAGRFAVVLDPSPNIPNRNPAVHVATDAQGPALEAVSTGTDVAGFFHIDNQDSSAVGVACVAAIGEGLLASSRRRSGVFAFGEPGLTAVARSVTAAIFGGNVQIFGGLRATSKSFVIDHPLDPGNRNLVHASVESSEQANVYSGTATLDENGEATVELPEWMGALNDDFRYQLTCLGQFAPVYIAEEVSDNRFKIAGGSSRIRVSWQLTGLRKDAWAQAHPLRVEEDKSAEQRGHYRHPEMFGEGPNASIFWAGNPDLMARLAAL
jgi:hypothetical protein